MFDKYLKSWVYGGLDGIITTFAIVSGVIGASLSYNIILILGFANLIGDGISMAAGDYISTKAENDYKNEKRIKCGKEKKSPIKNSIFTFISFLIFGFIPLLVFLIGIIFNINLSNPFLLTTIFTAIALFTLGVVKVKIIQKKKIQSGFETLFIGGIAAGLAYFIGKFLSKVIM